MLLLNDKQEAIYCNEKTKRYFLLTAELISHFPIEQRTGSSRLFGGTFNKQYAEYGI
jgi:hypothetical protein